MSIISKAQTVDVKCWNLANDWLEGYSPGHYTPAPATVMALAYVIQQAVEDFIETSNCTVCGPTHLRICPTCEDCEKCCKCEECQDCGAKGNGVGDSSFCSAKLCPDCMAKEEERQETRPRRFWLYKNCECASDLD